MPYDRPSLSDLIAEAQADAVAEAGLEEDPLRRADLLVHARVQAGLNHGVYGYVAWTARQLFVDTAEEEALMRRARIHLEVPRKPAAAATCPAVSFTVQPGAVVPAGVVLKALDGQLYETTAAATGAAPLLVAPIRAQVPGVAGNRPAGQALSLVSPVDGVQSSATAGLISGGTDIEHIEEVRARLIFRLRNPPQGGSAADYEDWARSVPGVTRAWVTPNGAGAGTVVVRFVRDGDVDLIPSAAQVQLVRDYILARRPATATPYVLAPTRSLLNFSFLGLTPDNAATRNAVAAELADLLRREAVPGGILLLSHIRAAISQATGERDYVLAAPAADVVAPTGAIFTLGNISWPP